MCIRDRGLAGPPRPATPRPARRPAQDRCGVGHPGPGGRARRAVGRAGVGRDRPCDRRAARRRGRMAVVPGLFDWHDVGDFATLADLLPADDHGIRVLGDPGQVLTVEARGALVVPGSGRTVVVLGLDDVVVIDAPVSYTHL